jgi:hypothetical protein
VEAETAGINARKARRRAEISREQFWGGIVQHHDAQHCGELHDCIIRKVLSVIQEIIIMEAHRAHLNFVYAPMILPGRRMSFG